MGLLYLLLVIFSFISISESSHCLLYDDEELFPIDLKQFEDKVNNDLIGSGDYEEAIACYEWAVAGTAATGGSHALATIKNMLHVANNQAERQLNISRYHHLQLRSSQLSLDVDPRWISVFKEYLAFDCPFDDLGSSTDPIEVTNAAIERLLPNGKLLAAWRCLDWAHTRLKEMSKRSMAAHTAAIVGEVVSNANAVRDMLTADFRNGVRRRLFHSGNGSDYPDERLPVRRRADNFIKVFDGALSQAQCRQLVHLFENSPHYVGNIIRDGQVIIDYEGKKASEFDVSGSTSNATWAAVDLALLQIATKYLNLYESINPALRNFGTPFGDEGFRIKRYKNDGTEHHAFHIDSGTELLCKPRRVIAFILYLNGVDEGGETVFLQQGKRVKPACGRAVIFPTSFNYVHAGRRPVSNTKYNVINFVTY